MQRCVLFAPHFHISFFADCWFTRALDSTMDEWMVEKGQRTVTDCDCDSIWFGLSSNKMKNRIRNSNCHPINQNYLVSCWFENNANKYFVPVKSMKSIWKAFEIHWRNIDVRGEVWCREIWKLAAHTVTIIMRKNMCVRSRNAIEISAAATAAAAMTQIHNHFHLLLSVWIDVFLGFEHLIVVINWIMIYESETCVRKQGNFNPLFRLNLRLFSNRRINSQECCEKFLFLKQKKTPILRSNWEQPFRME